MPFTSSAVGALMPYVHQRLLGPQVTGFIRTAPEV